MTLPAATARRTPASGFAFLDAALDPPGSVLAFAHRGGAMHPEIDGLENTLTAFRHAVEQGYEYLETDVHVTSDGVLLAFHDTVLDRVSDLRGVVAELTHEEVRRARIGEVEGVPTLAQLFDEFPGVRFNIDLKAAGSVAALVDFLEERDAFDRVLVGSFSHRRLSEFRRLTRGRVATSASPLEVAAYRLQPSARLADLLTRRRFQAFQVPHRHRVGGVRIRVTTDGLIRRAHATGKHVHVWTIDEPAEMAELIARGVDGLMTDRTDILKAVLDEHGKWRGTR